MFIKTIRLWNSLGEDAEPIETLNFDSTLTIFPGDLEIIPYYDPPANDHTKSPEKIEIIYTDRYGNEIKYTARISMKLGPPNPRLTAAKYIQHDFEFPNGLR